jgi:hypothetical protein
VTVEETYGLRMCRALKARRSGNLVTMHLSYADIQKLKQANHTETLRMFRGLDYATIQTLKEVSPELFADELVVNAEEAVQQPFAFGPSWFSMLFFWG